MEKQYWPAVKERKPNHAYLVWAGFYMGLLSLVNILLAFLISPLPTFLLAITAGAIAILIVWAWRQGLRNSILHVHSVLNMLGGAALGVLAAHWLADQARVIEFLAGFAVMDFISFTRFGKWTLNRKLADAEWAAVEEAVSFLTPPRLLRTVPHHRHWGYLLLRAHRRGDRANLGAIFPVDGCWRCGPGAGPECRLSGTF